MKCMVVLLVLLSVVSNVFTMESSTQTNGVMIVHPDAQTLKAIKKLKECWGAVEHGNAEVVRRLLCRSAELGCLKEMVLQFGPKYTWKSGDIAGLFLEAANKVECTQELLLALDVKNIITIDMLRIFVQMACKYAVFERILERDGYTLLLRSIQWGTPAIQLFFDATKNSIETCKRLILAKESFYGALLFRAFMLKQLKQQYNCHDSLINVVTLIIEKARELKILNELLLVPDESYTYSGSILGMIKRKKLEMGGSDSELIALETLITDAAQEVGCFEEMSSMNERAARRGDIELMCTAT